MISQLEISMTEMKILDDTELEILDDAAVARRWFKDRQEGVTPEAIARWLDRIANKKKAGHLRSFKAGGKRLYRLEDVKAYEARAKNSVLALTQYSDEDLAELDPAYVPKEGSLEW